MPARPGDWYFMDGKVYWRLPDAPPEPTMSVSGGGRWQEYGQVDSNADNPKQKRTGILGIFVRLRSRPGDPGHDIAKRVVQDAMARRLEDVRRNQEWYGPQAITHETAGHVMIPQVFDPPRGGYWQDGMWHDR